MSQKWTQEYMRTEFVDNLKQKRAEQGYAPDIKPTHDWLRNNGFGYFLIKIRDFNKTPDEWLLNQCGFVKPQGDLPCTNQETVQHIESWLDQQKDIYGRLNQVSVKTARCHIKRSIEITKKTIGTSDIFELGRGEQKVCFNRAETVMKGFKNTFDNENTRQNYVTTLRDLLGHMQEKGVVEHNPFEHLAEVSGWGSNSNSINISPSTQLVKNYIDACETRTEQMVMVCLIVMGWRPSDFCDPEAIDKFHFDSQRPYVKFAEDRKNGQSLVPIVVCQDFIEQWVRLVETTPGNTTALFPSNMSNDGARSTEWVRNTVERIGDRVDGTLRNGDKPTPSHFRNFWYSEYMLAYNEFTQSADFAASAQGSQSPRIPIQSYSDPLHSGWFDTFERVSKHKLAKPVEDLEPADEIGNIAIDEIDGNAEFDLVETTRQAKISGWESVKTMCPTAAVAYLTSSVSSIAGRTVSTWGRIKHRGMAMHPEWKHYPEMSLKRQAGLGVVLGLLIDMLLAIWYRNGTLDGLISGEITSWSLVCVTVIYGAWLFDRKLPDPGDAVEALR